MPGISINQKLDELRRQLGATKVESVIETMEAQVANAEVLDEEEYQIVVTAVRKYYNSELKKAEGDTPKQYFRKRYLRAKAQSALGKLKQQVKPIN